VTVGMLLLVSLVCWIVVIPALVVALRLRRARLAEAVLPLRRACERRYRLAAASPLRARTARLR
jgi:hypothetical protein